jgi:hydrogenase assembly chaperone HypC/HupF
MVSRRRIDVVGTVQGIGFRPYVYRLAREQGLTGSVRNEAGGVGIELQGEAPDLDEFERRLLADLPPSGSIERTRVAPTAVVESERGFVIDPSAGSGAGSVSLAPDHSVCADCLRELADPRDRRYRYPFINCTRCGPRLTITRRLPYDRANTTMDRFALCEACQQEYSDPADRRYHAEPLACPACGPRAWLVEPGGDPAVPGTAMEDPAAAVVDAAERLSQGQVVAIKGIGGFHLAANGRDPGAVARLRQMKRRSRKPLALMVRELKTAQSIARLDAGDEQLLAAAAAPILLARRRSDADVAAEVAPGVDDLGLMLPYSPLHRLLLDSGPAVLVMTSGNEPGEPITADNRQALERLKADAFLLHDREIRVTNDDSVIRSTARGPVFLRRARGYVPLPIATPQLPDRRVLALGASLKVTVATLSRAELVVGPHLGDLDHARAADAFGAEVRRMLAFARVEPEAVAVDLHPDLVSVVYAEEQDRPRAAPPRPPGRGARGARRGARRRDGGDRAGRFRARRGRRDLGRRSRLRWLPRCRAHGPPEVRGPTGRRSGRDRARADGDQPARGRRARCGGVARFRSAGGGDLRGRAGLATYQQRRSAVRRRGRDPGPGSGAAGIRRGGRDQARGRGRAGLRRRLSAPAGRGRAGHQGAHASPRRGSGAGGAARGAVRQRPGRRARACRLEHEHGLAGGGARRGVHGQSTAGPEDRDRIGARRRAGVVAAAAPPRGRRDLRGPGRDRRLPARGGLLIMCLAVPMRVIAVAGDVGRVCVSGMETDVGLDLVEDVAVGDYVIVHAGFAIQRLTAEEATETLAILERILEP